MRIRPRIVLFLCLTLIPWTAARAQGQRAALVIGNAKYEAAVGPLRNAVNDAAAVAKALRGLGFAVTEAHNVTRDKLMTAVMEFRGKARDAEVALFYFAGHGIQVGGSNYLLPVKSGYDPAGAEEGSMRLLAETRLFNAEQAVAEMSASGARCSLVILDACRSTPVARNPRSRDAAGHAGLTEMKPPAGSLIAFATDAGHTANDGEGANGLYTGELIRNLCTPGLTIEQVFKRTRAGVLKLSNGAQVPAEYSRLIGDDIYLAGRLPAPAPAPPLALETPAGPDAARPAESPGGPAAPPSRSTLSLPEITRLAAAGEAVQCVAALQRMAASQGPGDFAAAPLEALLEQVKESLKGVTEATPVVGTARDTCALVLDGLHDCLPPDHAKRPVLTAKAQNRLGDCLLLLDRAEEALTAYEAARALAPEDAYILYNRGRAHLALGHEEEAVSDFTAAADVKFKQPGARKLALEALARLKPATAAP